MKTIGCLTCVVMLACAIGYFGCSKSNREEAIQRVGKAAKALNGGELQDSEEHAVPTIVAEQQRKERIRQNTQWTPENQARHPIEYCQAMLADIDEYAKRLDVVNHKMLMSKSAATREIVDAEMTVKTLTNFLSEAKSAYRECVGAAKDHIKIGGFDLTLTKAKERMVEANRKIPYLQERIGKRKNMIVMLDKNLDKIVVEQKRLVETKERIQHTISDLQLKNVIDGEQVVRDALNAINDSIQSLGVDYDDPTLMDIVQPSKAEIIDAEFEKLMAE